MYFIDNQLNFKLRYTIINFCMLKTCIELALHGPVFIVTESQEHCSVTDNRATRIVSHQISIETK